MNIYTQEALNEKLIVILKILKTNNFIYNDADFAKKIGISRSFLSDMKSGNKVISEQTILKIVHTFPCINKGWFANNEDLFAVPIKNSIENTLLNTQIDKKQNLDKIQAEKVEEYKSKYQEQCDLNRSYYTKLLEIILSKDTKIENQAKEIGRLEAKLEQLKIKSKKKNIFD